MIVEQRVENMGIYTYYVLVYIVDVRSMIDNG